MYSCKMYALKLLFQVNNAHLKIKIIYPLKLDLEYSLRSLIIRLEEFLIFIITTIENFK